MKVITLSFAYDMIKLFEIGRFWAKDIYVNKEFISEYSAASYATFIDKNPSLMLHLYTDDVELMKEKISKYNINTNNIIYYDYSEELNKYAGNLKYSFDILHNFILFARSKTEYTIKIDCDLTFFNAIPTMNNDSKDVLVWKYERKLMQGNPKMGEIMSSINTVGNIDYPIYNVGLLGMPLMFQVNDLDQVYHKMAAVDIIDVSDLKVHSWHCAEQTAKNWIFYKYKYNVIQTYNIVNHHFSEKKQCIFDAKYLLK
jgi:hypothetical protein